MQSVNLQVDCQMKMTSGAQQPVDYDWGFGLAAVVQLGPLFLPSEALESRTIGCFG